MTFRSWRKTPPSENSPDRRKRRAAGSALLITVFVSFLFTSIGLGLVLLTRIYREWSRAKSDSVLLSTAAENGLRERFGAMAADLTGRPFPLSLTAAEFDELRASALAGGAETVEAVLGHPLPAAAEGAGGRQQWTAELAFKSEHVADAGTFYAAAYTGTIASRGRLAGRPRTRRAGLDLGLSVMCGCVPLSVFPFLLAGETAPKQAAELLGSESVVL
ncbi:MAG: hypothetical protein JW843_11855, partial [Candidatus Aminicenantes bacterium]|nr:hypothetical protein [Candidatus Aminicenantes bacterium]